MSPKPITTAPISVQDTIILKTLLTAYSLVTLLPPVGHSLHSSQRSLKVPFGSGPQMPPISERIQSQLLSVA